MCRCAIQCTSVSAMLVFTATAPQRLEIHNSKDHSEHGMKTKAKRLAQAISFTRQRINTIRSKHQPMATLGKEQAVHPFRRSRQQATTSILLEAKVRSSPAHPRTTTTPTDGKVPNSSNAGLPQVTSKLPGKLHPTRIWVYTYDSTSFLRRKQTDANALQEDDYIEPLAPNTCTETANQPVHFKPHYQRKRNTPRKRKGKEQESKDCTFCPTKQPHSFSAKKVHHRLSLTTNHTTPTNPTPKPAINAKSTNTSL